MKSLLIVALLAAPAAAGPDFTSRSPQPRPHAASTGSSEIGPLDDIVFDTNSTELSESAYSQLDSAVRWLKKNNQRVVLEGYADSTGFMIYNEDLATRRAFVVRQYFVGNGISPDRVVVVTYGEIHAFTGDNPLDRRVVMYATKLTPQQVATASLDRKNAISVAWTQDKALFTEKKRGTVIGTR